MTQKLRAIDPLVLEGVEITVQDHAVHFIGVISMRSPGETVTPFLRKVHEAVIEAGVKALTVDITKLRFMNSSSIRSLVGLGRMDPRRAGVQRYGAAFRDQAGCPLATRTTLNAIQSFGGKHVVVHPWLEAPRPGRGAELLVRFPPIWSHIPNLNDLTSERSWTRGDAATRTSASPSSPTSSSRTR